MYLETAVAKYSHEAIYMFEQRQRGEKLVRHIDAACWCFNSIVYTHVHVLVCLHIYSNTHTHTCPGKNEDMHVRKKKLLRMQDREAGNALPPRHQE